MSEGGREGGRKEGERKGLKVESYTAWLEIFSFFRGHPLCMKVRSANFLSIVICMAYSYGGGPNPRKLDPQIISVIQLRVLL